MTSIRVAVTFFFALLLTCSAFAQVGPFLVNERNASTIWTWDPVGGATSYHSVTCNDADLPDGSTYGWIAEHFGDSIARFVPGSGSGVDQSYSVPYAYPKHITFFLGEVVVMSRNDATLQRYDENGASQGSIATGNGTGQGLATNGTDLYASFWNGANSFFERYDPSYVLQETIANPTGMGALTNIVDFVYEPSNGHFYGLATSGEGGTGTETTTVVEFVMGGAVVATHTLPFLADGIGQFGQVVPVELLSLSVE